MSATVGFVAERMGIRTSIFSQHQLNHGKQTVEKVVDLNLLTKAITGLVANFGAAVPHQHLGKDRHSANNDTRLA